MMIETLQNPLSTNENKVEFSAELRAGLDEVQTLIERNIEEYKSVGYGALDKMQNQKLSKGKSSTIPSKKKLISSMSSTPTKFGWKGNKFLNK